LGIIGRNGAGKSTLLKIVAGLLQPTEGSVVVRGQIQALMDLGTGFHPEFTGRQNVYAALSYRGITGSEARHCFEEVVEFTELEEFIDNPLKTYSTGMHARLAFAVATSMAPGILIIDEVLGAGDAYFFNKSSERMRQLVESGASILLVTHALDQITRFCKQAIGDRGRIVRSGPSLEVVKAYQQYVRVLEDRRLQAKNYKVRSTHYRPEQYDLYSDSLVVRFEWRGQPETCCDIDAITLWKNDHVEEVLRVGDAQDSDITQTTFVILEGSHWWSLRDRARLPTPRRWQP
jgi:lipopolysaccharide transport system ATP-binding protein